MTISLAVVGSPGWASGWTDISGRLRGGHIVAAAKDVQQIDADYDAVIAETVALALPAAAAGKSMMVPLATPDLTELQRVCDSSGGLLSVYQPLRYSPAIQALQRDLSQGHLGELGLIRVHRWRHPPATLVDDVNDLDVVLWLVGKSPSQVYATRSGDVLQVHLGFDAGEMALIDFAQIKGSDYYSLSAVGSEGSAYADDHHNMNVLFGSNGAQALTTPEGDLYLGQAANDFIASMVTKEPVLSIAAARRVLGVTEAISQSLSGGEVIEVVTF